MIKKDEKKIIELIIKMCSEANYKFQKELNKI